MNIQPFKAIYPNLTLVTSPDSFFGSMKHNYPEFIKSGFFHKSAQDAIYVYQISSKGHSYRSIIAINDIKDIKSRKILKHEETLASKEQSMMQLILQRKAMIKPVLLAYEGDKEINVLLSKIVDSKKAFFELVFDDTGETHTIYAITDSKKVRKLQNLFKNNVKKCYIADGHHRVSTAMILSKGNHLRKNQLKSLLSVYFPFEELEVYDYNRSIQLQDEESEVALMAKLSQVFNIKETKPSKPKRKHQLTMLLGKLWYRMTWKRKILNKYKKQGLVLDTDLLNKYVLNEIMTIEDIRTNVRVKYVAGTLGIDGVVALSQEDHHRVGFCLYPVTKNELKYMADNGLHMPPKSTWFEPRIKNGLIVQEI